MNVSSKVIAVALMAAAAAPWSVAPAVAVPAAPLSALQSEASAPVEAVRWRGGGGAAIGGFVAGALIGGAIASQRGYGYGGYGYGGYGPGPGYYDQGYAPRGYYDQGYAAQGYVVAPRGGGGEVAYCQQRFRSYDPGSGTYLGFDGLRHSCP